MALRFEGYVMVSADGMLADATHAMPPTLRFKADQAFFNDSLDQATLIVHGRHSREDQPNSPQRRRIWVTRRVGTIAPDPSNPKALLWNPAWASFEEAAGRAGVSGTVAVIGGPDVFALFLDRYDIFWLSRAPHVRLPGGAGALPGVPAQTPEAILAAHGLAAAEMLILDQLHDVTVTAWRRARAL